MENQPKNLSEIIGSGAKVIITVAGTASDKRVRLGRIIEYDAVDGLISVQQEDDGVCLIPLCAVSSIEVLRKSNCLNVIGKR